MKSNNAMWYLKNAEDSKKLLLSHLSISSLSFQSIYVKLLQIINNKHHRTRGETVTRYGSYQAFVFYRHLWCIACSQILLSLSFHCSTWTYYIAHQASDNRKLFNKVINVLRGFVDVNIFFKQLFSG